MSDDLSPPTRRIMKATYGVPLEPGRDVLTMVLDCFGQSRRTSQVKRINIRQLRGVVLDHIGNLSDISSGRGMVWGHSKGPVCDLNWI